MRESTHQTERGSARNKEKEGLTDKEKEKYRRERQSSRHVKTRFTVSTDLESRM